MLIKLSGLCAVLVCITGHATAEDAGQRTLALLLQDENVDFKSQHVHSPGVGMMIQSRHSQFIGLYNRHVFYEPLRHDYPDTYHSIDALLDIRNENSNYLFILRSESDRPILGGMNTFEAGAAYGKPFIHRQNLSLILGGGLAVGDLGDTSPVIPVPLVRLNYKADRIEAKFELLTSPNFDFTWSPAEHWRVGGEIRMDQFRDERDLVFALHTGYRFFDEAHKWGDFAGLSLGFKNDSIGEFSLAQKDDEERLELHYYSVFAKLNLSLLQITVGNVFGGRALYRGSEKQELGEGYCVNVQFMLPL